ncbi:acyl-CoA ligase (AMP-forming), exosortase A system-associated [Pelomonas sp. SE-A7]|uniref:acyl-CoA ligase (AMP-forming), exosortase A system-associated n=1 Tax=Pelomonas sp. SE-A7 TaxID=3054953 RepID=UPI00259CF5D2|nr:acyl-CoA ligase (AMP-forming), exosortase A system-associated [Pelomonas sp. SE-A7]MDM4764903.1 acyl-CoA ligase (AMP-forming), exosortase A system-associated [Pelomonas sp. SE-A7]
MSARNDASHLHHLILRSAEQTPEAAALSYQGSTLNYAELATQVQAMAAALVQLGLPRAARVGIYLEKRFETVVASFAAPAAGLVFVPLNPLLKPEQVGFILRDCEVQVLITSPERHGLLGEELAACPSVRHVVLTGAPSAQGQGLLDWTELLATPAAPGHRVIDTDMAAILYTSGSTGKPKGVVLSHRNMVAGAKSVASYLENRPEDTLLAALPLSFDAGFSQLTTAFHSGARVVLLNYLLPRDVLKALEREKVTGLTAVPPLYIQLTQMEWPAAIDDNLRYFANTGGRMPRETLEALRQRAPSAKPFLMYGLTEAFRSTYLPPEEVDRRPDSIGKAIPNAEILVLREDGSECAPDEPGELVHRGALVGMGYWNDAEKTAERYKLLPGRDPGLQLPEYAVFSGDNVRKDGEGFLYFIGRRDEMIKTSGYRVSPNEVEEILYATKLVGECVAFGVEHAQLGQAIQVIATPPAGSEHLDQGLLAAECRKHMPAYMLPAGIEERPGPLPRNPNGKIDRKLLSTEWAAAQP